MGTRLKKTTKVQYEELLEFVDKNRVLIHGKTKPAESRKINKLWEEFANKMNNTLYGPIKSAKQWKKILIEWKVNTKRKSRIIQEGITGTGAGPCNRKSLSDMEERLISIISKIHLGAQSLPDSLGGDNEEGSSESILENPSMERNISEISLENHCIEECEMEDNSAPDPSIPALTVLTPTRANVNAMKPVSHTAKITKKPNMFSPARYTNSLLESACSSYEEANQHMEENAKLLSSSIDGLAKSIENYAEVYKIKAEASMLRAKAEYAKAKCMHYKEFGSLDDFQ